MSSWYFNVFLFFPENETIGNLAFAKISIRIPKVRY